MHSPGMEGFLFFWGVVIGLPLFLFGITYNRIIRLRNMAEEAWSGIDVQLKRRHELIPRLVDTVKAYADHEKQTLEDLTRLRERSAAAEGVVAAEAVELELSGVMRNLIGLAEAYPELKANENFLDFQDKLVETEDRIEMARRYFNGSVRNYNTMIEAFPGLLVARVLKLEPRDFFEIEFAMERDLPTVSFTDKP
jgi:LemA protein